MSYCAHLSLSTMGAYKVYMVISVIALASIILLGWMQYQSQPPGPPFILYIYPSVDLLIWYVITIRYLIYRFALSSVDIDTHRHTHTHVFMVSFSHC